MSTSVSCYFLWRLIASNAACCSADFFLSPDPVPINTSPLGLSPTYLFKDVENKVLFFDAKTNLQEIVQGEGKGRLKYVLVGEEGPDHAKIFTVEARLGENVIGTGSGHSKKSAEQHCCI